VGEYGRVSPSPIQLQASHGSLMNVNHFSASAALRGEPRKPPVSRGLWITRQTFDLLVEILAWVGAPRIPGRLTSVQDLPSLTHLSVLSSNGRTWAEFLRRILFGWVAICRTLAKTQLQSPILTEIGTNGNQSPYSDHVRFHLVEPSAGADTEFLPFSQAKGSLHP
jgi:hypothetical protein